MKLKIIFFVIILFVSGIFLYGDPGVVRIRPFIGTGISYFQLFADNVLNLEGGSQILFALGKTLNLGVGVEYNTYYAQDDYRIDGITAQFLCEWILSSWFFLQTGVGATYAFKIGGADEPEMKTTRFLSGLSFSAPEITGLLINGSLAAGFSIKLNNSLYLPILIRTEVNYGGDSNFIPTLGCDIGLEMRL